MTERSNNRQYRRSSPLILIFGLSVMVSLLVLFGILSNQFDALAYSTGSISVGSNPAGIAFNPANGNIYVANHGSNTISVISGSNNTIISTLPENMPQSIAFDSKGDVCFTPRLGMAFDPVNGNLYVPDDNTNSEGGCISGTPSPTIVIVGSARDLPTGVAFDSANDDIYLTNQLQHTVSVINPTTNSVTATINVGTEPVGITFDSANGNIYVTNQGSGTVSVISGSSNNVTATINVGIEPVGIAIDSAKGKIYVTNAGDNTLSVISDSTNTATDTIPVGPIPFGVTVDSANGNVYVTNSGSNTVTIISGSNKIVTITALSSKANFNPNNSSLYGQLVTFTATVSPSIASGTMAFTIDGIAKPAVALSGGIATLSISSLTAGSHTITATYSGDTKDLPSTSSTLMQTVYQNRTATTLSSSTNPSTVGQAVTFTAMVSPNTATGTITLTIDGVDHTTTLYGGQASFITSSLAKGTHSINATYSGDVNYIGSTSSLTQAVALPPVVIQAITPPQNPPPNVTNQSSAPSQNPTQNVTNQAPTPIQNPMSNVTNHASTNLPTVTSTTVQIPQWIHNNAKWWSEGTVGDKDFVQGIQYLIQQKVIVIPTTTQTVTVPSNQIPAWIKGVAGWWANGKISDDEFVKGIQFLVQVGIIKV